METDMENGKSQFNVKCKKLKSVSEVSHDMSKIYAIVSGIKVCDSKNEDGT